MTTKITVMLATYNRMDCLKLTCDSFLSLDLDGLSVEFVVIDNNSSDNTWEILQEYKDSLPIKTLYEPKPGKNAAINRALNECTLGDLIVFTDDDVLPQTEWLKNISSVTDKYPDIDVFGGRILPSWPENNIPDWVYKNNVLSWGFSVHEYSNNDTLYASNEYPFGPNFWVRNSVFADGRRFDESIGPKPKSRIMGSETSFLKQLAVEGYEMLYSPLPVVEHRINAKQLEPSSIFKRAVWQGRSIAYMSDLPRANIYERHYYVWLFIRITSMIKWSMVWLSSYLYITKNKRVTERIQGLRFLFYHLELIKCFRP